MVDLIDIAKKAERDVKKCRDLSSLEDLTRRYLGKKGSFNLSFQARIKGSPAAKKKIGQEFNAVKQKLAALIEKKRQELKEDYFQGKISQEKIDIHQPGQRFHQGHLHPLTRVISQVEDIFQLMGFSVVEGPEMETEYYNFDALNIPADHPARDAWNTFWLKKPNPAGKSLLKTHTSPNQVRYMEQNNPPLRIIAPGACYRHEATDRSHGFQFLQVEGLMVDREISLANFKAVVERFCCSFFGPKIKIRITPDYFPFTEPSLEISILDKKGYWLEIMGAGLVHPNVFKTVGYKPGQWQGFAFGMGVERLAMIKFGLDDVRMLYQGDLRLIQQF